MPVTLLKCGSKLVKVENMSLSCLYMNGDVLPRVLEQYDYFLETPIVKFQSNVQKIRL